MKKAKVSKGIVRHVWPHFSKGKWHELPEAYQGLVGKQVPECIVDVPDEVERNWVWDGEKYAKRIKIEPSSQHSDLLEMLAEKLGTTHDELMAEWKAKKKARRASETARGMEQANVVADSVAVIASKTIK